MKLKCPSCGKKEAEVLSKVQIINRESSFTQNFSPVVVEKIIEIVEGLFNPKYLVCNACGHVEDF